MKQLIIFLAASAVIYGCGSKSGLSDAELDALANAKFENLTDSIEDANNKEFEQWRYESEVDEMTSEKKEYAMINSKNQVELAFPHAGGTYATITLRRIKGNEEVVVTVNEGQIHTEYNNPVFQVRFDENKPEFFTVNEAADHSIDVRFISNARKFIDLIKKSKETKIEMTFYNNGTHVFKFDTKDLKW
ncbi:hypothetical protein D3C87_197190 [compost metagenome]